MKRVGVEVKCSQKVIDILTQDKKITSVKTQDETAFIHTENFILIDKKGRIRGVYNGTLAVEKDRILRHIEMLKKES